jgi:hypothetical protein
MDVTIATILERMGDRVQSVTSTAVYGNKQISTTVVLAPTVGDVVVMRGSTEPAGEKTPGEHLQTWLLREGVNVDSPDFVGAVDLTVRNAMRDTRA